MHARNRTWLLGSDPVERCRQRTLPVEGGDGSTLSLDFTTGVLDPRLTFTRSTTATYINSQGYVTTMAAAPTNDPTKARFDYDPSTLQPRGLLIEGSANNLLFWSESFASSGAASNWAYNSNTAVPGATTTNPAGGTTAFQFAETANSGPLQQTATVTNAVHTFSAWFKASTYNSVTTTQVSFGLFTTGFLAGTASIVSGPGSTAVAGNIVTLSGLSETQWTRVQFTTTAAIPAGAVAILIYPQTTNFEVNRSFYIWGAQLETGSGASSYIPTGASQGSRGFDYCEMENIIPLNYSTTNGSMLYEGQFSQFRATSFATMRTAFCTAAGAVEAFGAFAYGSTMYPTAQDATGNTALATITPAMTINTNFRAAWSLNASLASGEIRGCINGGSVAASGATSMSATATPTILTIGGRPGYGAHYPCGTIKRVKYWPTTLSDATLQSITT